MSKIRHSYTLVTERFEKRSSIFFFCLHCLRVPFGPIHASRYEFPYPPLTYMEFLFFVPKRKKIDKTKPANPSLSSHANGISQPQICASGVDVRVPRPELTDRDAVGSGNVVARVSRGDSVVLLAAGNHAGHRNGGGAGAARGCRRGGGDCGDWGHEGRVGGRGGDGRRDDRGDHARDSDADVIVEPEVGADLVDGGVPREELVERDVVGRRDGAAVVVGRDEVELVAV